MPINRLKNHSRASRIRPAGPRCRGGVSSVLRLAQPAAGLVPTRLNVSDWLSRAADVMMPVTGPHFAVAQR